MQKVEKDEDWHLFCPDECPLLATTYGLAFKGAYDMYVTLGKYRKVLKAREIWKAIIVSQIELPNKKNIDFSLVIGALLFGIGWGMVGFCPGPAISSIALLNSFSLLFIGSMIVGFYLSQIIKK